MGQGLKKRAAMLAALLCLVGGLAFTARSASSNADSVYYGGKIYTMTDLLNGQNAFDFSRLKSLDPSSAKSVEVVAVKDGKIVFAGSRAEARAGGWLDAGTKVDLQGHVMLPGLVDGHGHFPSQGMYDLYEVNLNSRPLGPIATPQDIYDAIGEKCGSAAAGEWVLGWNYDDSLLRPAGHPLKDNVDAVCPSNPVWLRHISGHMGVANQKALDLAKANDASGYAAAVASGNVKEATGLMLETKAQTLILTLPSFPENASGTNPYDEQKSLARAGQVYAAAGITAADDGAAVAMLHLPLFQEGLIRKAVKVRVVFHPTGFTQVDPGTDVDQGGFLNRATFGWVNSGGGIANPTLDFYGDGTHATKTGADITQFKAKKPDSGGSLVDVDLPSGWDPALTDRIYLGAYKFFTDGSPQGYTALMKRPGYYDWGGHTAAESYDAAAQAAPKYLASLAAGNTSPENMKKAMTLYHKYGVSTQTHTNGNLGAEQWLAAMEAAISAFPAVTDTRHTSIHAQFMELQQVQRMTGNYAAAAEAISRYGDAMYPGDGLGGAFEGGSYNPANVNGLDQAALSARMKVQNLFNSYYVNHTWWWGKRHYEIFQGPGRADNMSPTGWSIQYDQPFSFHNDTFVLPIDQLRSMQSGVTRATAASPVDAGGQVISGTGHDIGATVTLPARKADGATLPGSEMVFPNYDHRVNPLQAALAVTAMPAWQNKLENKIGSIRTGLLADFVILDQDPLKTDPMQIANIRVTSTIVGDEVVHGFLPGSTVFVAAPAISYYQPDGVSVSNIATTALSAEEADRAHALRKGETRYGAYDLDADVSNAGDVAVFQMDMLGNDSPASAFTLYSIAVPTRPEKFAYAQSRDMSAGGNFWIAPMSDPQKALAPGDVLAMNKSYVLFCTMEDGGKYDVTRSRAGADPKITGAVSLATTGSLPTNSSNAAADGGSGGDGGGCTIGATPSYDLVFLLLAASVAAVLRLSRRRGGESR